jgi:hypothetical protein
VHEWCAHLHAPRKRLYRLTGCNCTHAHTPSHAHTSQSHLSPSTYSLMCAFIDITEARPLLLALTSHRSSAGSDKEIIEEHRPRTEFIRHRQEEAAAERATGHLAQLFRPWLPLNTQWTKLSAGEGAALLRRATSTVCTTISSLLVSFALSVSIPLPPAPTLVYILQLLLNIRVILSLQAVHRRVS